jgi:hypothetical protein
MKPLNLVVIASLSSIVSPLLAEGGNFENTPAPIGIYMSFDGSHSDRAVAAMQREVEGLTKASGFHLQWRSLENRSSEDAFSDLMVVKLRGSCNMQGIQLLFSELGPDADGGALGSTKTSDGQVLPFSELYCDRIRRSIAPLSIGASPEERESLLGRAMGRVLAHELFHVFANTGKHGQEGVAKTAYSRKDLVADVFVFDAKDAKRMERTGTR